MFGWFKRRKKRKSESKANPMPDAPVMKDWERRETWEDYPCLDYDAVHTYCSISFDNSESTFYYRTKDPDIRVGDLVYVPVGRNYEWRIGRVVAMEDYVGYLAPYPLSRTKHIIRKVDI